MPLREAVSAREIILSPEQHAAIFTPGNLVVRAGAGSGKTEVLARRFVALVAGDIGGREPLAPDRMAAITFTEKAAWDMRARIEAALLREIAASVEPRLTSLRRAIRLLPLARISTIHAFCARILRENSAEAGLDPDFQVLDEHESQTYFEKICKRGLVDAVRGGDKGALHLVRARRMADGGMRESGIQIVMRIVAECARMGRTPEWVYAATRRTAEQIAAAGDRVADLAAEIIRETEELLALKGLSPAAASRIAELRPRWPEFRKRMRALNRIAKPEAFDVLRDFCPLLPAAQALQVKPHVNAIREIVGLNGGTFGLKGTLIGAYGEFRGGDLAVQVAELIRHVAAIFERAKTADRVVTFDDLLLKARDLLRDKPEAANRYRAAIRALLVDEYQDTDPVQDEIVSLLGDPATPDSPAAPELFIVGDEKQSIYRFRGADVRVFNAARESAPTTLPLSDNRRSAPNILRFVNALGALAMKPKESPPPPYWVEWRAEHELRPLRETTLDPPVEIIAAIGDGGGASADDERNGESAPMKLRAEGKRPLEAAALAARISALLSSGELVVDQSTGEPRPAEPRDIVILLRAFSDVAVYERALVDAGIPSYTVKGRGFFGCREVVDLTELLAAVNDERDSPALAAALRSPFFMLSDRFLLQLALRHRERASSGKEPRSLSLASAFWSYPDDFAGVGEEAETAARARALLRELRELHDRGSIMDVIDRALAATGYEAVMLGMPQGRQRVANLRKLAELARDFQSQRFFNFHDFVAHLRRLVAEEPHEPPAQILGENEQVVRLMTVHQAKGLEFPVVIVADAGRSPGSDNLMPVLDRERGLVMRDAVGSGMDEIPNPLLDQYRKGVKSELEAESMRLMYVALTRARDRLIVSEGASAGEWVKKIRGLIGADTMEAFIESDSARREILCGGARIVLLRPGSAPPPAAPHAAVPRAEVDRFVETARRRLSFAAPVSDEVIASPTALADYDRCPRQYELRRSGVREAEFPGSGGSGGALLMGTVAHSVLEQSEFGASGSSADGEIRRLVEAIGGAAGLPGTDRDEIARDLARYAAQAPIAGLRIQREVPFFLNAGGAIFVRGQIDVIADDGDRILVRDYKYARPANGADSYQAQMECYALAAAIANPGRRVGAEIVFLRGGAVTVPIALPDMEAIRARLMDFGRAIAASRAAGVFARKPPDEGACRRLRCGYVMRCWKH
jgi:ATP-dependent helicase/nuclease subunit A